jgi:3-hydroxyisobutyrate dehydrogenase-like beta-hydroxyacid dehydrogenase
MHPKRAARVSPSERWLIVGHGSVGSFVAERLARGGAQVAVLDREPRVPIATGVQLADVGQLEWPIAYVVSCVPPGAAHEIPGLVSSILEPSTVYFEWNTVSPTVKREIRDAISAITIDVALLDSLDVAVEHPSLAISGQHDATLDAAALLRTHGFAPIVVGDDVGDAAALKYLRSTFMKGLEALVLEYESLAFPLDGADVVRSSLASSLGEQFVSFMDLLVSTNRIHAGRRSRELEHAIAAFSSPDASPRVLHAAVEVLAAASEAWDRADAPPPDADVRALACFLRPTLWPGSIRA